MILLLYSKSRFGGARNLFSAYSCPLIKFTECQKKHQNMKIRWKAITIWKLFIVSVAIWSNCGRLNILAEKVHFSNGHDLAKLKPIQFTTNSNCSSRLSKLNSNLLNTKGGLQLEFCAIFAERRRPHIDCPTLMFKIVNSIKFISTFHWYLSWKVTKITGTYYL